MSSTYSVLQPDMVMSTGLASMRQGQMAVQVAEIKINSIIIMSFSCLHSK